MGSTAHEIPRLREAGDHPAGRVVAPAVKRTLEKLGIPRATFYRWSDLYQSGGPEALDDRRDRIASGRTRIELPALRRQRIFEAC